jgi:hypothetical protein
METESVTPERPEDQESAFNGALHTLERIHNLINHVAIYHVNGNLLGYRNNLEELMIEGQGFFTREERVKGWRDFAYIRSLRLQILEDGGQKFDENLPGALDDFNRWLRLKLHNHKVTIAGRNEIMQGLGKIAKRYGINA